MNDALQRAAALREILRVENPSPRPQPVAEAVVSCCLELIESGEPRLARDLAELALKNQVGEDAEWVLRVEVVMGRAMMSSNMIAESLGLARRLLRESVALLERLPDERFTLRILEAANLWHLNRVDESVGALLAIRKELLARPDSYLLGWCAYHLCAAETKRGEYESARRFATEAIVSARRCGSTFVEVHATHVLCMRERALCRWHAAYEMAAEALETATERGYVGACCHLLRSLSVISWKRGRLQDALRFCEEQIAKSVPLGDESHRWFGALLKGMILLHAGDYDQARRLFTSGDSWTVPESESRPSLLTTEFLGDIHLEQGDGAAALMLYDEVFPKAMVLVPRGDIVAELRRRRAECYLLLGRNDEAYDEVKTGLHHCRELGDRYEEAATYRLLAIAAATIGRPAEAKKWFEQGFAYYDDIETPFEWGKLWMSYGDWLSGPHAAEYSDAGGALEAYRAAEEHFERMGALAKLAEARRRIAVIEPEVVVEEPSATSRDLARPRRRPRGEAELERRSQWAFDSFGLVTRSRLLLDLLDDVAKLARSTTPILVLGESGTGKELIAAGIHRLSGRSGAFTPLNSAAIAKEMFESELFGHVAGAFTGATRDKPGLMEISHEGTVFLDEIAEMPIELQSRLLRFLETGEIRRVGSTRSLALDTRLVAATNRDRGAIERAEGFRSDLYYRLAHAVVELPPIRQRGDDVEVLLDYFLDEFCAEEGKRVRLSPAARARLIAYPWPGNVRQMRSLIRRVVILTTEGTEIREGLLQLASEQVPTSLVEELELAERGRIATALDQAHGSRTNAAKALGMKRTTLLNKMRRYGMR